MSVSLAINGFESGRVKNKKIQKKKIREKIKKLLTLHLQCVTLSNDELPKTVGAQVRKMLYHLPRKDIVIELTIYSQVLGL